MSCFRLIEAEKASHSVPRLCRMLGVSRSGYSMPLEPPLTIREGSLRRDPLREDRDDPHKQPGHLLRGSPGVHAELRAIGIRWARGSGWRGSCAIQSSGALAQGTADAHHTHRASLCSEQLQISWQGTSLRKLRTQALGCGHNLRPSAGGKVFPL